VYLTCRELGGTFHASFHESGAWHIGFVSGHFEEMFDSGARPASRFTSDWQRPVEFAPGWTVAARIYTPWYSVTSTPKISSTQMVWVAPPSRGNMSEICVLLAADKTDPTGWPGRDSMGTALVGTLSVNDGSRVWVVSRSVPLVEPPLPDRINPRFFKGATAEDFVSKGLLALMWGCDPNGAAVFFDAPVSVGPVASA
jgi:hypothetical protein